MDANKKVDFENLLCLDKSKILADILKNHPLIFNIVAFSSVPWIYLGKFWHTLHEDGSKYALKFILYKKSSLTLDDFGIIFHLPQATDNNHDYFVLAPTFSKMISFYINDLSFTLKLRSTSNFKTTGLLQAWQTLCKIITLGRILLLLKSPTTLIPYLRFTKLIASHYMTAYPEISRRVRNTYHNLADDVMIKSIFSLGKSKVKSTQGTHRKTSAPRSPNPIVAKVESSAPQRNDDDQVDPGTRLEPRSDKESPEVEKIVDMSQPVNDDPYDDAHPEGENSAKRQKISEHGTFEIKGSSYGQDYEGKPGPSTLDYKNLNKNDIEDLYLLIINHKVDDYAKTGLLWSLSVFIKSIVIWERVYVFQLVYGIIYENSKKENRVMRHQEVHKFCDATLKRVLKELKSYNNNVKYGYVTHNLSTEDVEYL
uniref:Uncharacterized protein n=1 Tax=Tanacetum cinerariifolium TaxID=118510 RepID=A0A6L2K2R2_TANCI|nr:hypothetical protein [Tanacetum cinerariifolium]